jgi:hypothetical protein
MNNAATLSTYKMIETKFAATLAREGFKGLEVCMRGMRKEATLWTIVGELEAVKAAAEWLEAHKLLTLEEAVAYDEECAEAYAYMTSI